MVRILTSILLLVTTLQANAQTFNSYRSMVQFGGTASFGMMRDDVRNLYLQGFINIYPLSPKVSFRGDAFYFLNGISDYKPLVKNHQLLLGGFYHFKSPGVDPYIGFQPGFAFSQRADSVLNSSGDIVPSDVAISPLTSLVFGFNYFGSKHFSLFLEGRLVRGFHLSNSWPKYLDEFRISFGLAFQFGGNYNDSKNQ